MYITTQVADWLLTKRFWSNQARDQLAVVGMTLAMGLTTVATNWQLEGPAAVAAKLMELDRLMATGPRLETWSTGPTNWRLVIEIMPNWWLAIEI